jgi:LysR family transcriptional regulator, regulator for bpeEF and oprC
MNVTALNAFVKVVQTGSFTRAADALGTQKAYLSRVVTQLEKELGVRLLERTTRSLSLTEVGRELFERAVGILAAVDDAQRAVQHAQGEPRGMLRLTCGVEFGLIAVSAWIDGYLKRYPQVQIEADFTGRIVDIVHEGFDLAIRVGPLSDSSLAARRLGELQYGLFASRAYLDRRGMPAHPRDLQAHDLVVFSGGSHRSGWALRSGAELAQVALKPRLRVNNSFAVRDAAAEGLGIAQLPLRVAQPGVDQGRLVPVLSTWVPPAVPVHAVFASARYLTPKVRAFIDHAADAFQGPAGDTAAAPP